MAHQMGRHTMKFGVLSMNTDEGINPLALAREAEDLGIESVFLPDHSHIPVHREVRYGGPKEQFADSPGDYPREYYRNRDQLLTLAMMAAVTSRLKLGTGICLVVQRDPIYLAKEVATIDDLSNGRVLFGVGGGAPWNLEEMRNHGTDTRTRFALFRERIEAIKEIWTEEQAEYHGKFVDFDPIFSWPKPVQQPHPPILVGGRGPTVLERVLAFGDGWMPGDWDDVEWLGERIAELQERAAEAGRAPIEVTINRARLARVDDYLAIGASRCIVLLPTAADDEVRRALREVARVAESTNA
jgi:probable F420-dependent oxidoreductase